MQPIEIALFGAVIALAAGLIGYILWPFARGRREARVAAGRRRGASAHAAARPEAPQPIVVCPACQREYDAGLQFCPHDARELVPVSDPAARAAAPGMTCPSCRRSFDAMKRFCPFDGDELVPLTLALGSPGVPAAVLGVGLLGKICPHCSRRYESDATFCGRDGAALVSVN
jgi:predicted amidophosphoribosyltransferase